MKTKKFVAGQRISLGGQDWIVLDPSLRSTKTGKRTGMIVIIANPCNHPYDGDRYEFGETNDYEKSAVRELLLYGVPMWVAKDAIIPYVANPVSKTADNYFLMSADEYVNYAAYLPEIKNPAWTRTKYRDDEVDDGVVFYDSANGFTFRKASECAALYPACVVNKSMI